MKNKFVYFVANIAYHFPSNIIYFLKNIKQFFEGITGPDFKLYYKATEIKSMLLTLREIHRSMGQNSPEINP